jgi:hypothetical protein
VGASVFDLGHQLGQAFFILGQDMFQRRIFRRAVVR